MYRWRRQRFQLYESVRPVRIRRRHPLPRYQLSQPLLKTKDKEMFYKYLDKSETYFEYGSGGSTYQASVRSNIKQMYSVESDLEWHNKLKTLFNGRNNIALIYNDMDTRPRTYGHPGPNSTPTQKMNYSNQIRLLASRSRQNIDLVLIDGRFRVACCLKCFDVINDECLIAFDDFLGRQDSYRIVLDYYEIVDRTEDNRMVILKKKQDISLVPEELIREYELIRD